MGILLSLLVLFAAAEDYGTSAYANSTYYIGKDVEDPLTIEKLRNAIDTLPNPSIENLLPVLKELDPSIFKNYVFMYHSRSLQPATPENPRILLATAGAEMVLAFNGSPQQQAFRQLEVMFFDRKTNRFNFQEIDFSGPTPTYSQLNPAKCLACHQSSSRTEVDPRPNWEPYNVWPGALNSVSGFTDIFQKNDPRYNAFLSGQRDQENEIAKKFFRGGIHANHPRYKYLEPFLGIKDTPNYVGFGGDHGLPNRMPTVITDNFGTLNGRRLARMIQEKYSSLFEIYKYSLLSATLCGEIALPQNVMEWHRAQLRQRNLSWSSTLDGSGQHLKGIDQAFDFIFKAYGVDTKDWSMDFNTNGEFAAFQKYGLPSNLESTSPNYAIAFREVWGLEHYERASCKNLRQKSLETVGQKFFETNLDFLEIQPKKDTALIQRCVSCHVDLAIAPYIPFDNEALLKDALQKDNGALMAKLNYRLGPFAGFYEAMPPQGQASAEDKKDLLDYLQALKSN